MILKNLTKWQNYVHYLLLTGGLFLTFIFGINIGLLESAIFGNFFNWVVWFLYIALGVFVFDTIIHFIFSILPEPFKWED